MGGCAKCNHLGGVRGYTSIQIPVKEGEVMSFVQSPKMVVIVITCDFVNDVKEVTRSTNQPNIYCHVQ